MYSIAAIAFIVAAATGAGYLAQRPTLGTNEGLAQLLHDSKAYGGTNIKTITCDDEVPIGVDGARYHCTATDDRGVVDHLACNIFRTGSFKCDVEDTDRSHVAPGVNSWD